MSRRRRRTKGPKVDVLKLTGRQKKIVTLHEMVVRREISDDDKDAALSLIKWFRMGRDLSDPQWDYITTIIKRNK